MNSTVLIVSASLCLMAGAATAQTDCLLPHDPVTDNADAKHPPMSEITDPKLLALIEKLELEDELAPEVVDF